MQRVLSVDANGRVSVLARLAMSARPRRSLCGRCREPSTSPANSMIKRSIERRLQVMTFRRTKNPQIRRLHTIRDLSGIKDKMVRWVESLPRR